jgi:hypothetical protein
VQGNCGCPPRCWPVPQPSWSGGNRSNSNLGSTGMVSVLKVALTTAQGTMPCRCHLFAPPLIPCWNTTVFQSPDAGFWTGSELGLHHHSASCAHGTAWTDSATLLACCIRCAERSRTTF